MNIPQPVKCALYLPAVYGGGAERVMINLAKAFAERGLQVDMVMATVSGPYVKELPAQVRIVDLGARRVLTSLPALVRYLRSNKPSFMLSTLSHANIIAIWARRIARIPVRLIVRQANILGNHSPSTLNIQAIIEKWLVHWFYPWADRIVAPSEGLKNNLVSTAGLSHAAIDVVHNPVIDQQLYQQASLPIQHPWFEENSPPVILSVGRLTKQKDFVTLIKAFALVRQEYEANLLILGEGEARAELQAVINSLHLNSAVLLPGFVDNPFVYMAHARLFVLSSAWEGLPNALLQALALGTEVIATDCQSGPSEILQNGRYGQLVPVGDVRSMAEAIINCLTEPTNKLTNKEMLAAYSVANVSSQYLQLLMGDDNE